MDRRKFIAALGTSLLYVPVIPSILSDTENPKEKPPLIDVPSWFTTDPEVAKRRENIGIVMDNARNMFPESIPYLEDILKATGEVQHIFEVPFSYAIALLYQESRFNPFALSPVNACGIAQFMRPTAMEMGLETYDLPTNSKLNDAEVEYYRLKNETDRLRHLYTEELDKNDFDSLIKHKLEYDYLMPQRKIAFKEWRKIFVESLLEQKDAGKWDQRFHPKLAIPACLKYYAINCYECQEYFHGRSDNNLWRGANAYNAGLGAVIKNNGMPVSRKNIETPRYGGNITFYADQLESRGKIIIALA